MATPKGTHFVISAVLVSSGAPVYRRGDGSWTTSIQEAHPAIDEAERDAMLRAAQAEEATVCDPYAFAVRLLDGAIDPLTAREKIRAEGPTVPYGRPDHAA
jgi:hypothetical protein